MTETLNRLTHITTQVNLIVDNLQRVGVIPARQKPVAIACHPDSLDAIRAATPTLTGIPAITSKALPLDSYTAYESVEDVVAFVNVMQEVGA